MTVPLPGGMADELMWHLSNCPKCRQAKVARVRSAYCDRGKQLLQITLVERHGER